MEQPAERAVPERLTGASGNGRVVLLQQTDESAVAASDVAIELAHSGRGGSGDLRVVGAASVQHLHHLDVGNDRSAKVAQVRASGGRKAHGSVIGTIGIQYRNDVQPRTVRHSRQRLLR